MNQQIGFARCARLKWAVLLVTTLAVGCGDESPPTAPPVGGAGAGGAVAGAGGAGAGGAGAAGMGAAGTPAVADEITCAGATAGDPAALHAAAVAQLLPMGTTAGPCAFGSCHDASSKKAKLQLTAMPMDLKTLMVGVASCEAPALPLVDASGGDAALAKSWLWQKLVAPAQGGGVMTPKPEWGTAAAGCSQDGPELFGARMPRTGTDMKLGMNRLGPIRDWICAGAPGP